MLATEFRGEPTFLGLATPMNLPGFKSNLFSFADKVSNIEL